MNTIRLAVRRLFRAPGFTLVALATLALGIGANTAIFSVMDQVLVRPLPVEKPGSLALLGQQAPNGRVDEEFNYPVFREYQRHATVFSQLSATASAAVGLGVDGVTERQTAALVSGNYFSMLGVDAALGRTFAAGEGAEIDDAFVVVLGHGAWQRRFGADPGVLGRSVLLNGVPFTVIGIAPREFAGTTRGQVPDLYVPITTYGRLNTDRPGGEHPLSTRYFTWHSVMGRLREGVDHGQATEGMRQLARRVYEENPSNVSTNLVVEPGLRGFMGNVGGVRVPVQMLMAISVLVLLMACANLANLQLVRALGRQRDFAIRIALGAARGRIVRELLAESLLLSTVGGLLGLGLARGTVVLLRQWYASGAGVELSAQLDLRVLLFAGAASVLTGVLFGLAPAIVSSSGAVLPALKVGAGSTGFRLRGWNLRGGLVVFQVAVSLLVLVSAGLCVRSLSKLQGLDPGFEPSRAMAMSLDLRLNNYSDGAAASFYRSLLNQARTVGGVEAAALAMTTPLSGDAPAMSLERLEGYQPSPGEHPWAEFNFVTPDYFRALGVRLLRGRVFEARDDESGPPVVVVNEAFAKRYWPGENPVGKQMFRHGGKGPVPTEVVGVVGSTLHRGPTEQHRPMMFFPAEQEPQLAMTLVVRSSLESGVITERLRAVIRGLDPAVPVFRIRTLAAQRDGSLAGQRMAASLLSAFGVLALLLAGLGLYGIISFSVNRLTREIGVRMALGAQVQDVVRLILSQGFRLVALGLGLGLVGAGLAGRLIRGFLFGIGPWDPATFIVVGLALAGVAGIACWLPAARAARIDPMSALRQD